MTWQWCSLSESSDEQQLHHTSVGNCSLGGNSFAMATKDAPTANDETSHGVEGTGGNGSETQGKGWKNEDSIEDGDVTGATIYFKPTLSQPSAIPNFLQDDQNDASYKIDETLTALFKKLNINKLVERLEKAEQHSSAAAKQNEEMAKKLGEMESANDALKIELAQSGRNQAALLDNMNKLLARLEEKESVLCNMTKEKNDLVERIAAATGLNNRIESEIQEARAGLLQATAAASMAEATAASLRNDVATVRDDIQELRRENSSLHGQLNSRLDTELQEFRASLLQATSKAAEAESNILSLRSENGELRTQSKSLQVQLNESRASNSEGQEVDTSPLPSIGFEEVSTTTDTARVPNGYHGLNWKNVGVVHRSLHPGSGFARGIVSGNYVASNGSGKPCSISSTTPFSIVGFQATAASRTGLHVFVESFDDGGNRIGRYATTLGHPRDGPTFIDLGREGNFEGLYKLKITTSGGTDAGLGGIGTFLAIDDQRVY